MFTPKSAFHTAHSSQLHSIGLKFSIRQQTVSEIQIQISTSTSKYEAI